jgi:hypothetical protein
MSTTCARREIIRFVSRVLCESREKLISLHVAYVPIKFSHAEPRATDNG